MRLVNGIIGLVVGIALLLAWAWPRGGWVAWAVTVLVLIAGAFSIFEARAGWCVVRAMGFKTRF